MVYRKRVSHSRRLVRKNTFSKNPSGRVYNFTMISIPKKIEYSLTLVGYLSKNSQRSVSLAEVAKKLSLPYRFLGQLAGPLKKAGIVEGKEGKSGGYRLTGNWADKSVFDVMESLGENKNLVKCLSGGGCQRVGVCRMAKVWKRVEESFVKELKKIKLSDL